MNISEQCAQMTGMSLGDAVVQFARSGVPVFPCWPGAKNPLVEHGFRAATTGVQQVTMWWRRWPQANIGIPTGPASGIDVVDVDVKGINPRGYDSFERGTEAGLLGGWDTQVVTPSGGLHIYYRADEGLPQRSWQAAKPQVDFRGDGGYVVAPPSRLMVDNEAVRYRLLDVSPNPTHPVDGERLRNFLDPRPAPKAWPQRHPTESVRERAERLANWMSDRIEGERNRGLFWASCRLAEAGAAPAEVLSSLGAAAEQIRLSPREIETTIQSAYRAAHAAPAPLAPPASAASEPKYAPAKRQELA